MSRIIYNAEGLFVGPSGSNFLDYIGGEPHDSYASPLTTHNLIKQIDRVQALSYDISVPHTNHYTIADNPPFRLSLTI